MTTVVGEIMDANLHKRLYDETMRILATLTKERMAEKPFRRGGVNWADLKCCDVEFIRDLYGDERYRVVIDEVSPDEDELRKYVGDALTAAGFENIEIETEW